MTLPLIITPVDSSNLVDQLNRIIVALNQLGTGSGGALVSTVAGVGPDGTNNVPQAALKTALAYTPANIGAAAAGANTDITSLGGLTTPLPVNEGGTGSGTAGATAAHNIGALAIASNLSDVATPATARSNIGAAASGTNTDITSLASPALGSATATTQTAGDNSTKVATTAYVSTAVAGGGGSAFPSAFSTKSANYTFVTTDKNTLFNLTGSFAGSLPSASSFGAGNGIFIAKTDGSGVWALTPASGTIDGKASISVYQERFALVSDGANWQSVNRSKGWISLGATIVSSPVASVLITQGFADIELNEIQVDVFAGVFSTADNLALRVQKGGSVISTSTYHPSTTYVNAASTVAANTIVGILLQLNSSTSSTNFSGTISLQNFLSSTVGNQRIKYEAMQQVTTGYNSGEGWETTASAIQGISILANGGSNINAGNFVQKGFRP